MIRYFRHINDQSIWEELEDVISKKKPVLLANLGFSASSPVKTEIHPPTSRENFVEEIISWCTEHSRSQLPEDLTKFSSNGHLEEARFQNTVHSIEKFLQEENKRACFKHVLLRDQVEEADVPSFLLNQALQDYLCQDKHYEDFLRDTYLKAAELSLARCHKKYLWEAIDACRDQKPFVFAPYDNIEKPVSTALDFSNQVLKSLSGNDDIYWKDLRKLLTDASTLFMQFDVKGLEPTKHPYQNDHICRCLITKKGQILQPQVEKLWNKGKGISTIEYEENDELVEFLQKLAVPPVKIYIAYARKDKEWREELKKHLTTLQRQMKLRCNIILWDDGEITAGTDWQKEFKERLVSAHVILLLVSPDFLSSEAFKGRNLNEIETAMGRHDMDKARVIPIILRSCLWEGENFARLYVLPPEQKPITKWTDPDEAFTETAKEISKAIKELSEMLYPDHL